METPTPRQERINKDGHTEKGAKPSYRMTPEILSERADALLKKIDSKDGQIDWKTLSDEMPKDGTETSDRSTAELIAKHGMALLERASRSGDPDRIEKLKKLLTPFVHPEEIEAVISTKNKKIDKSGQKNSTPKERTEAKPKKSAESNYNATLTNLRNRRDVFLAIAEGERTEAEKEHIVETAERLIHTGHEMHTRDGRGLMWDAGMILSSIMGLDYTNELLVRVQQKGGIEKVLATPQSVRDLIDEKADGSPTGVLVGAKEPKKDLAGLNNEIDIFTARRRLKHGQYLLSRVAAATLTDTPDGKIDTNHSFYGSLRKTSNAIADSAEAAEISDFQLSTLEHVKTGFRTHDPKYIQEALEVGGHYAFADLELAKRTFREILSQSNKEDKKEDAVRALIQNELSAIEASENNGKKSPKENKEVKPTTDEVKTPAEDSETKKESKMPKKPAPIKIVNTPSPQPRAIFSPLGATRKIVRSIWDFFTETDEKVKETPERKVVIRTSPAGTAPENKQEDKKTEPNKPATSSQEPIYQEFDDLLEGTGWNTKRGAKVGTKDQPQNEAAGSEATKNTEPETKIEANKSSEILAVIESILNLNTLNNVQKRILRKGIFEDKKYADSKGVPIDIEFLSHVLPIIELVPEGIETKIIDYVAGITSKDSLKLIFDYLIDKKKGKRKPELVTRLKERYASLEKTSAFQAMKSDVAFLKKVYAKLGGNPDEMNLSDEQQDNKEETPVPEKDVKGVSTEKFFPKVGDLAFWEKDGKIVFSEPKRIAQVEHNDITGENLFFLDGGTVGIPLSEIVVATGKFGDMSEKETVEEEVGKEGKSEKMLNPEIAFLNFLSAKLPNESLPKIRAERELIAGYKDPNVPRFGVYMLRLALPELDLLNADDQETLVERAGKLNGADTLNVVIDQLMSRTRDNALPLTIALRSRYNAIPEDEGAENEYRNNILFLARVYERATGKKLNVQFEAPRAEASIEERKPSKTDIVKSTPDKSTENITPAPETTPEADKPSEKALTEGAVLPTQTKESEPIKYKPWPKLRLRRDSVQETPQQEEGAAIVESNQTILTPDDLEAQMNRGKIRGGKEGRGKKTGKGKAGRGNETEKGGKSGRPKDPYNNRNNRYN